MSSLSTRRRWQAAAARIALFLLVFVPPAASAPADSTTIVPPRDVLDVVHDLLHGKRIEPELTLERKAGLSWVILPSISYNPLYGVAFGASANGAGPLGDPTRTRISSLYLGGNYSTTGQVQAQTRGDLFLHDNDLLLRVDLRYLDTERPTWGLGPVVADQQEYPMNYTLMRFYCTALWQLGGSVYAGIGYHSDEFYDIVDQHAANGEITPYVVYSGGQVTRSLSRGFSVNLVNDQRDNPVNPRAGYFTSASFRSYSVDGGESWQEILADVRAYPLVPPTSRHRLAFWLQTWSSFGRPPYLNLPHLGGDTNGRGGRGYVIGRIRATSLASVETEYRFDLRRDGLLGAVAFLSLTSATDPASGVFSQPNLAGGAGLRIKFNKDSDTNLTLDAGWGEQGSFGWFLGTTEVF